MPGSGRSEGRSRGVMTCCWRRRRRSSSASRSSSAAAVSRPPRRCATSTAPSATNCSTGSIHSSRRASCASAQDSDGEPRFWMLETIREFGARAARVGRRARGSRASGTPPGPRPRPSGWTPSRGRATIRPSSRGSTTNTRTCARPLHSHAKQHDGELLLRLATALWGFWSSRGLRRRGQARARGSARAQRPPPGADAARPLHAAHAQRQQRERPRGRQGGARGVRGAGRRLQPRPGLEPRRPRRGNLDGLACHSRGRLEAGALVRAPRQLPGGVGRDHLLADGERGLRSAAGRGGDRPQPRVPRARGRGPDDPRDVLGRARRARGDARRHRDGAGALAEGRRTIEEAGLTLWAALNAQETYLVEQLAGTPGAAAETLRQSYETLEEGGERAYRSTIAGFLAHALYAEAQGRGGGALQPRERAGRLARRRGLTGGLADSAREDPGEARRARARRAALAREAVRIGEPSDLLGTRGDALCDLAEVLALAGRRRGGTWLPSTTLRELFERKGNLTALARAAPASTRLG